MRWRLGLLVIVIVACGRSEATTTTVSGPTTVFAPTTSASTTTTVPIAAAPWSAAPLSQASVPSVLVTEWEAADNGSSCAALGIEGGIAEATPRAATFAGGWAIAWDAPDGPGMAADGTFCPDCGRSAVGVAGAGVVALESDIRSWPNIIEYDDGSLLGYGIEGAGNLTVDNPATGSVDSPTQLAFLSIAGQDCLYNVWSRRSVTELRAVIDRLRFVEGLGAPTS